MRADTDLDPICFFAMVIDSMQFRSIASFSVASVFSVDSVLRLFRRYGKIFNTENAEKS